MKVNCMVSCRNAEGAPDFCPVVVNCTQEQYDDGEHYEAAKEHALEQGYEDVGLAYDENDGPARLFEGVPWDEAPVAETGDDLDFVGVEGVG